MDFELLANRPDCLSVWGLARESAAVLDEHFVLPEIAVEETGKGKFEDYAKVIVEDTENCPRYCARVITNVKIGPSPKWMREDPRRGRAPDQQHRGYHQLRDAGNRASHARFRPLQSARPDNRGAARQAREKLVTLDGKEHLLSEEMLVIADHENATGLAGIMGGEESEIVGDTASVLFECAAFDRTNNRITARKLGMRTEASGRFEKGVCPATAMEALERACMLVNMLECGQVVPGAFDCYPHPEPQRTVTARVSRICSLVGVQIPGEQMEDILDRLNLDCTLAGDEITCEVPAYRQDIETEADIAEEVLRMVGYEHIPSTWMKAATMPGTRGEKQTFLTKVKRELVGMGLFEILNYSFISPKWLAALQLPEGDWRLDPLPLILWARIPA